jgi:hypothetical protein
VGDPGWLEGKGILRRKDEMHMTDLRSLNRERLLGMMVIGAFAFGPMTSRIAAQIVPPVTVTGPVGVPTGPVVMVNGGHSVTLSERLVWPHLRFQVRAIGDRLTAKGKERAILSGSITRGTTTTPIQITSELSGSLLYQEQGAGGGRNLGSDGKSVWAGSGSLALSDTSLVETLINDSPEHFLVGQMTRLPTRFYGAHFRTDDGRTPNYTGPFYDVYEVGDQVVQAAGSISRTKVYALNSRTGLLEQVRYKLPSGGAQVRVQVLLGNWKQFQNQQFPTTITRTENGQTVFTVAIASAVVSPGAADGIFSPPR